jgi:uncharacterized LabA/DUF88 family protein
MVRPAAPAGSGLRGFIFWGHDCMTPVALYFDGFNLYHALLRMREIRVKWLDLRALSQRLILGKTEEIKAIYYFSAYADWLPGPKSRHEEYVKALSAFGVTCVMGHFKKKHRECKSCGSTWVAHEEKETDVSIGITLLNDAYKNVYEKAYLVTRDSDLMPAVRMVLSEFAAKQIVAVAPPMMGHSNDLISVCSSKKKITPAHILSCLLPQTVMDSRGVVVAQRPMEYN